VSQSQSWTPIHTQGYYGGGSSPEQKKAIKAATRHIKTTVADVLNYTPQFAGIDGSAKLREAT
jgi:hypothetical protein